MTISVSKLSKTYGAQKAVNSISFEIKEGEIVGFLGPNGAGKSSTLKMLIGLLPIEEGSIEINGYKMPEDQLKIKAQIGFLAEHNPMYKDMYIREFLEFVGSIRKVPNLKVRIEEVIKITGLSSEANKKIAELSKGYQQRVGIAHAIIHNPPILILDEPTSGLDPNQMLEIRNLIKQLGQQKIILFSSHILSEVEAICDRVLLINKGNLVADTKMSEIQAKKGGLAKFFEEKTKN
ncbi:ATP-binding cassette domain-containing protein [Sandaracinomonas limnophila]|uniref:ATP-binding cassette domain-containing protein n=1 Tax=Sandaracinomonas limnophila TaxID=1862386 RepID=A0A437PRC7_9BACT|nr:ATP-binding cassette domain-containing protein [Sandaracinomonas limnophila]RVU24815.1 ATP-binding cassette domain-containing protein [Sandaracinomonas limnophila]